MADEDIKQGEFVIEYVGEGTIIVIACSLCEIMFFIYVAYICNLVMNA